MRRFSLFLISFILFQFLFTLSCSREKELEIYATTDLHGMLLPFDNTEGKQTDHSLANLASITGNRNRRDRILLDNGDILQGDPLTYYYNFVDTTDVHIAADILNYLGYDAGTAGNHDIETGHPVYDRVRKQYNFPLLAANAVDIESGKPYFKPYTVIKRKGLKVVVFGLITPSVPQWLPKSLYSGIRFENMVATATKWMPVIKKENPDLIIGLFHSGIGRENETGDDENSSLAVAYNVPGFDIVLCGHDHRQDMKEINNVAGEKVVILDGGSRAEAVMNVTVTMKKHSGNNEKPELSARLIPMNSIPESEKFIKRYSGVAITLYVYTSEIIGKSLRTVTSRDAFFGRSGFVDLIHSIQLDISGAEISLAAPLSFDQTIDKGDLRVRDMFRLYRYENFLYTLKLTGEEIDKILEYSAALWFDTMEKPDDYMLKYRFDNNHTPVMMNGTARLRNPSYSFDSAMGIRYTVDVSKHEGERVNITSLSDGTPFSPDSVYTVAVNSYRANGGGGHFSAAGITGEEMEKRIINATDRDIRYYMMEWIKNKGTINPAPSSDWKIVPEAWASAAEKRERPLLFGIN